MQLKNHLDIAPEDLEIIRAILNQYVPNLEVWAFGSRTTGKARKFSDLDLAVINKTPLDFDIYATLKEAFSESHLPFKVDVIDWAAADEKFKNIIKQHVVVIQTPMP